MVTIYLDQAKWTDLGRAMHGRTGGERFRAALPSSIFGLLVDHHVVAHRRFSARLLVECPAIGAVTDTPGVANSVRV